MNLSDVTGLFSRWTKCCRLKQQLPIYGGQLFVLQVCRRTLSLKLVLYCGDTVKWDKLLWIIILIIFGLKSNWRFTSGVTNKDGFPFSWVTFLGGSRRFLSINGRKAEAEMGLTPTMCHLMGTEWITLLQMCLVFVFFILVPITTNRNNENWIHFLGAELSKPLRGYSGYPAEA